MSIRREDILRCACDLYLSDGIDGFSMRKLAQCVGCTAPALYRHYESKNEVIQEVVSEAYRQFTLYLYRALEGRTPVERFLMGGRSYVDFATEQPALYEIIYLPRTILEARGPAEAREPHDPLPMGDQACAIGQFWSDRVREMMDAGYLEQNDPYQVSMTLWAHGHGMVSIYHRGLLGVDGVEEFRVHMAESFVRVLVGLGTARIGEVVEKLQEMRGRETVGA